MTSEIKINSIGSVKTEKDHYHLSIKKEYRKSLKGIEGFSHIIIIWWGNQSDLKEQRKKLVVNKPYKKGPDIIGIFATRSEIRPNPVLLTTANILSVDLEKGIIDIPWIDAENNSPIIDLKPYQPCSDRVKNVEQPEWCSDWPRFYEESAEFDWESVFNF